MSNAQTQSLSAIIESSDDAIIGLTLEGIITSWNPAAERMYGYTAREVEGESTMRLVPDELRVIEARLIARVAAGTRLASVDTSRVRQDGGRLIVSLSLFPILDSNQHPVAIAAIERDVTRQRALEAQLLQAKRMEAVARLAGGVAQEFNNMNTAILGLVEFIGADLPADSPSQSDLAEITKQAMRGSRLARHLLGFSGRQMLSAHTVSVDEALRSMEPLLQRLVGERGWLTLELNHGNVFVSADEAQLELVIFELVINATDAIGDRGAIAISTRRSGVNDGGAGTPANIPPGDYVEITIRDSGAGMSEATRALAFDPFFTTKADKGHVGLGLAMVYGVVQQLGGYVATSGTERTGTEISVFLPVVLADASHAEGETHAPDAGGTETILVVEDEDPVRAVVTRGLRASGYNVLEAKHGEDALIVAGDYAAPIHLVVSDVVMPQMDGRALFDHLRNWYPNIRFLFISGYTRGAITGTELQSPSTEFLAKPFSVQQLSAQVRRLLDRPRPPNV